MEHDAINLLSTKFDTGKVPPPEEEIEEESTTDEESITTETQEFSHHPTSPFKPYRPSSYVEDLEDLTQLPNLDEDALDQFSEEELYNLPPGLDDEDFQDLFQDSP